MHNVNVIQLLSSSCDMFSFLYYFLALTFKFLIDYINFYQLTVNISNNSLYLTYIINLIALFRRRLQFNPLKRDCSGFVKLDRKLNSIKKVLESLKEKLDYITKNSKNDEEENFENENASSSYGSSSNSETSELQNSC